MLNRRALLTAGLGLTVGAAVAGCSDDGAATARWIPPGGDPAAPPQDRPAPKSKAAVVIAPAAEAKEVSPAEPVVVTVEGGTLQAVTVTAGDKTIAGTLAENRRTWRSTGALAYGQTYTVAASAVDDAGVTAATTGTFATIKPTAVAGITFQANPMAALKTGGTYGVGQPVVVFFNKAVKDRAAAEGAMKVVTEPAVVGRWHWISAQSAHWRPEKYWTPGTRISVKVSLLGVHLGNGVYGGGNASTQFSIGPSRIAIADANTKMMQVFVGGQLVRTIPVSLGKGGTTTGSKGEKIDFHTRSGPHVVLTKESVVRMTSSSYGITNPNDPNYYDETIKLACRISLTGEYVHMADWNIPAHGRSNTSHGCVNVGPAHAQWFYDNFQVGDVVDVRNTPRNLPVDDGLGDWTIPWDRWV